MAQVVLASNNQHKLKEIYEILADFEFDLISMKEAGLEMDIEETGRTFEENSYIKAKEVLEVTNKIVIADDSGLEVFALNNEPGVYSARYAGLECSDEKNNKKLLKMMKTVPSDQRQARFVSVITMLFPDGRKLVARGEVLGDIGYEEKGDTGFGYDPLFIYEKDKTFAEISSEKKNEISHRSRSLMKLKELLEDEINPSI